jgi:hypothetical protein
MLRVMSAMPRERLTRLLALWVVGGLLATLPLCHASPPDPAWIAGLWDDGDHDDVVIAVLGTFAVVDDPAPPGPPAPPAPRRSPPSVVSEVPARPSSDTQSGRAPPLA